MRFLLRQGPHRRHPVSTERLYCRIMAAFETAYLGTWEDFYRDTTEDELY